MDRDDLSAAIIAEMGAVFMTALEDALPALLTSPLAPLEQQVRQMGRRVLGALVTRVAAAQAATLPPETCPACDGPLRRVQRARTRHLQGLVGDYTLSRASYVCVTCGQSHVPLDAHLGLGAGSLSPGLARVVCGAGLDDAFARAVERVEEALGVQVSAEVVRRTTEAMGQVAEAPVQDAMTRVAQGRRAWPASEMVQDAPTSGVLAVAVDGLFVHRDDAWHEMKVVTLAPLGPGVEIDADTQRERLVWGQASYGAGCEEAQAFWGRVHVEACRRGLGTPAVRTVVLLGDGADWIWRAGRDFLGLPGVEVVEILDLYHVYEYLWLVGNTVFGAGSAAAAAWVEPLKTRLYAQGAVPVQEALATLTQAVGGQEPGGEESAAASMVRRACAYFAEHAARLDYPAFVARALPIGSGAVESAGKTLVKARTNGAGMHWRGAGAQHVVSLRALHHSGRWEAFWASQPQRTLLHLVPRQPRTCPIPVPAAEEAPCTAPAPATPAGQSPAPPPADPPRTPPARCPAPTHPWRQPLHPRLRSA